MKANLSSSQILCWNCEEVVHEYAARCPYCSKDLTNSQKPSSVPTIQSLPTEKISPIHPIATPIQEQEKVEEEQPSLLPDGFTVLVSLAALLAGSFFLFFGVVIKLFSVNGSFVLEWKASSWPYFVLSSLVLLVLGLYTLSKLDKE